MLRKSDIASTIIKIGSIYGIDIALELSHAHRIISQSRVARTRRGLYANFGNIRVVFLAASDGAGAERMAIRLSPCEFKRLKAG